MDADRVQTHGISAEDETTTASWRNRLGGVGGLPAGPSPPLDVAATWRKGARALPAVDRQLVEQKIFQTLIGAGQSLDPFPGQFHTKALHPKMTDFGRETTVTQIDLDPGVRPQMEKNEVVQLVEEFALCRFPGIFSVSFDQTSAPTPGGIPPVGDSRKTTKSFRSCEKIVS